MTKQAILIIHGIGNQRPMATLRGFVEAVWTKDVDAHHAHSPGKIYSKPDEISGNHELRRLTTTKAKNGRRCDFFEYYWAHEMHGTKLSQVWAWTRTLLWRRPCTLPAHLRTAWGALIASIVIGAALTILLYSKEEAVGGWALLGPLFSLFAVPLLCTVPGDAARYLDNTPENVSARQRIRSKGIELLQSLNDHEDYERVIVVGHSLGSVIALDILNSAWANYNKRLADKGPIQQEVLGKMETLVGTDIADVGEFQKLQKELLSELLGNGCGWKVTDFVSLGSPLAHAEVLLANSKDEFRQAQVEREYPRCPPQPEESKRGRHISYKPPGARARCLHHAAVFGPTRWTNLFFPATALVHGDFVGGPLRPIFGKGVRDVPVKTRKWGGFLSHTFYWELTGKRGSDSHIEALREALNLAESDDVSRPDIEEESIEEQSESRADIHNDQPNQNDGGNP